MNLEQLKQAYELTLKQHLSRSESIDPSIRAYITALEAEAVRLRELHTMQLCAIMSASIQNTETTIKDRIAKDHFYWTQAYGDVCVAVDREMKHRAECERLRGELAILKSKGFTCQVCGLERNSKWFVYEIERDGQWLRPCCGTCARQYKSRGPYPQNQELSQAKEGK